MNNTNRSNHNQIDNLIKANTLLSERSKSSVSSLGIFTMALFAIFVAVDLTALILGIVTYRHVYNAQKQDQTTERVLSPLFSTVRSKDFADAIGQGEGPEGPSLVISETIEGEVYQTRVYLYENQLLEEYASASAPYSPDRATALAQTSSFSFEREGSLLKIHTDQGSLNVALRATYGGDNL